jgi:hypothetical protein
MLMKREKTIPVFILNNRGIMAIFGHSEDVFATVQLKKQGYGNAWETEGSQS